MGWWLWPPFWDCACVCWSLCSHLFEDSLVAKSEQSKSSMVSVTRLIWFHLLLGLASQFSVYLPRPGHTTDNLSYQPNAENWHCKAQAVPANCEKLLSKCVHTSIRRDSFNSLFGIPSILKQCQTVMYPLKMICEIILQILLDLIAIFLYSPTDMSSADKQKTFIHFFCIVLRFEIWRFSVSGANFIHFGSFMWRSFRPPNSRRRTRRENESSECTKN